MDADELALLAMHRLRGSGKLNDKNVDCFIQGYKTCLEALHMPLKLIPILQYHYEKYSKVRDEIKDYIGYADLRRGFTTEEVNRIEEAEDIAGAILPLIQTLSKYKVQNQ